MSPHDIARTLDCTSTRHTVVSHRHDIETLVAHTTSSIFAEQLVDNVGSKGSLESDWFLSFVMKTDSDP